MTKITMVNEDPSASFTEVTRVRKFAKHMLKSTLFIGTFQEKRFVEPLNSYRDVIKVDDDETDFIENLVAVKKRCAKFYSKNVWIGITEPKTIGAPAGYNLWVSLDEELLGSYWYKVKTVEFHQDEEVCLKLEMVRPVSREKTPVHNITAQDVFEDISRHNISELGVSISNNLKEIFKKFFSETLTIPNIKEAIIFIFLLVTTLITFLIHTVQYLLEYFLKLLHEFSGFVKVCSPIIISFMKLILNVINGFYALIAIMWRDRSRPRNYQNFHQMLPPGSPYYYNVRALPASPPQTYEGQYPINRRNFNSYRSSVRITPLN